MVRFRGFALGTLLALAGVACGGGENPVLEGTPPASPTGVPTVSIGACVTEQGAQPEAAPTGADWQTQLKASGVLNIGSDNAFPPFEEIKPGEKEPVGFDVDLYTEVAKRLGLTAKSTTTDFDGLFTQSIPRGQFDLGVSAITIKEARKKTVDFTIPYFRADLSLAVNAERTPNVKTIDDLAGQTLGAQEGTTGADCADALVKDGKAASVKKFKDALLAFDDLVAGRVAAVINDRPASLGIIAKRPSIKVVQVIETQEEYGMAISKKKPDLRVKINETLTAMMEDGTYATIYKRWFDTEPPWTVPFS